MHLESINSRTFEKEIPSVSMTMQKKHFYECLPPCALDNTVDSMQVIPRFQHSNYGKLVVSVPSSFSHVRQIEVEGNSESSAQVQKE